MRSGTLPVPCAARAPMAMTLSNIIVAGMYIVLRTALHLTMANSFSVIPHLVECVIFKSMCPDEFTSDGSTMKPNCLTR
jgi:hypothetical protein